MSSQQVRALLLSLSRPPSHSLSRCTTTNSSSSSSNNTPTSPKGRSRSPLGGRRWPANFVEVRLVFHSAGPSLVMLTRHPNLGRKIKCDGRSTCANCNRRNIPCVYVPVSVFLSLSLFPPLLRHSPSALFQSVSGKVSGHGSVIDPGHHPCFFVFLHRSVVYVRNPL
jgi:hypothetical protein